MISAYADKKSAIDALHEGAVDYMEKPVNAKELAHVTQHWASYAGLVRENARLMDYQAMHQSLQESQARYQHLVEGSPNVIYSFSDKRGGIYYSQQAVNVLGYSLEHLYANPYLWYESIHPDDQERVTKVIGDFKGGEPFGVEYRIKDACGNWLWFYDRSIDRREENGEIIVDGVVEDMTKRKQAEGALHNSFVESIYTLMRAAEFRDDETGAHVKRIGHYSRLLAEKIGMDAEFCNTIFYASPMHDIGKIGIPDYILLKPGSYEPAEREIMKTHATIGGQILEGNLSPFFQMGRDIALGHHERWDGGGYPKGIKGEEIPLPARIMQLVDVYDALRSKRPYKPAFEHARAIDIICKGDGRTMPSHFDPTVLAAFEACAGSVEEIFTTGKDLDDA
jgi:PAS domain S-box-containing protein